MSSEEEKVDIQDNIIPYESVSNNTNYNINFDSNLILNNNENDTDNNANDNENIKINYLKENFISNSSAKNLKCLNEDLNVETIKINSNKKISEKTINKVFKEINITNKINQTENKNRIKENTNSKLIIINKEDLYNAFIFFHQLYSKYKTDNENNVEYIKNKLFEFVSMKKNNFFSETIECNDNDDENDNEKIFDVQNYMPVYCKSDKDLNVNNNNDNKNNNNLVKNYSFSFSLNDKNKIINNYLDTFLNGPKDTIKSNSQIFNEYLLIDKKIKDKTISHENSKSFHHNYSFDLKHKDKNESSINSIPDKDKDKEKDKYFDIENNNKYNYENYNSYEKEIEHKSPFNDKGYRLFGNNLRKYSTEEYLLVDPITQKNKKLNLESNDNQNEDNNNNINNNLYNKNSSSIKEKILISPSKKDSNKNESFNNENNKCLEYQQSANNIHEIKVNKNKSLNYKEQIINEKIKELNEEIKKFKEETNRVTLLKEEYEKMQNKLLKDIKELNVKKQLSQKNYKGTPQSEVKLIMSITQHNQALILNNNKKKETIKLLRERIYELENIIKAKNNYEHTNQKNIFKKINNYDKNYFASERVNIFTKKGNNNIKKKNNESYLLKRARINLKKKVESHSSEKVKRNKNNNYNSEIINQTMNNNTNNNLTKLYYDNKNIIITNNNKKIMNVSYNHQNIKNNTLNSKLQNYNNINNNYKKIVYNANSNKNFSKKNHLNNNNNNITGINNRNNSINSGVLNNANKIKIDNPVIHTNLYIYEKLINKEREKEKNYKKINININSERDVGTHKKIIKELKTEIQEKNKYEKEKKPNINSHLFENKNNFKKYQKSQGKNIILNRLDLKTDIYKNKSNINILSSYKVKPKNLSINKKNIFSIRQLTRNTTNLTKNNKSREKIKNNLKEINNSLDVKNIKKDINKNMDLYEENENENDINRYDFVIPEIYKKNNDSEIINTVEQDGKIINIYDNNKKEIIFKSGVRKEIFMDGYQLVYFPNGDMKQKFIGKDEKVIYYYSETNTVQTTFKNGLNIFKFSNGQIEKHCPDGSKFIIYTNGIKRKISKSGREEVFMPDEYNKGNNQKDDENKLKKANTNENNKNIIDKKNDNNDDNNLLLSFLDIEKE